MAAVDLNKLWNKVNPTPLNKTKTEELPVLKKTLATFPKVKRIEYKEIDNDLNFVIREQTQSRVLTISRPKNSDLKELASDKTLRATGVIGNVDYFAVVGAPELEKFTIDDQAVHVTFKKVHNCQLIESTHHDGRKTRELICHLEPF